MPKFMIVKKEPEFLMHTWERRRLWGFSVWWRAAYKYKKIKNKGFSRYDF